MADPIAQFQIKKIVTLGHIGGHEIAITTGIERVVFADVQRPRGAVNAFGINRGAGGAFHCRHCR